MKLMCSRVELVSSHQRVPGQPGQPGPGPVMEHRTSHHRSDSRASRNHRAPAVRVSQQVGRNTRQGNYRKCSPGQGRGLR